MVRRSTRRPAAVAVTAVTALAASALVISPAQALGPLGPCSATLSGTTITLLADCTTTAPITVANGFTVDGNGFTITAADRGTSNDPADHFQGGVLTATQGTATAPGVLNVKNLTIGSTAAAYATQFDGSTLYGFSGIFMKNAGGTISNVSISGITTNSGSQSGMALQVRNAALTTPATLNIDGLRIRNYNKNGVLLDGNTKLSATNMDIGPAGNVDGTQQTAYAAGNGFFIRSSGVVGSITDSVIAGNRYTGNGDDAKNPDDRTETTALAVVGNTDLTLRGDSFTGVDSDAGVYVYTPSGTPSSVKITCSRFVRTAGGNADTAFGIALTNETYNGSVSNVSSGGNTFSGWSTNTLGPVTPVAAQCAPVPPPAVVAISVESNKPRPHQGKRFAIRGLVSPALAGVMVTLERRFGKKHKQYLPVATTTLPASGRIEFVRKARRHGNQYYRVVVGNGPSYTGGTSNRVKIHVR